MAEYDFKAPLWSTLAEVVRVTHPGMAFLLEPISHCLNSHIDAPSWILHASHAASYFCRKEITGVGSFP